METLNISEETKKEIVEFFLKTSVPRILEKRAKENEKST